MTLIVVSRVFKYKAFIIALALVASLAFFQSNQALNQSASSQNPENNETTDGGTPETPSIPETPNVNGPDSNDSTDTEESSSGTSISESSTSIHISITTNINTNNSNDGQNPGGETILKELVREFTSGSISLKFTNDGGDFKIKEKIDDEEGETSVKFSSKSNQKTVNEISSETNIEKEIKSD